MSNEKKRNSYHHKDLALSTSFLTNKAGQINRRNEQKVLKKNNCKLDDDLYFLQEPINPSTLRLHKSLGSLNVQVRNYTKSYLIFLRSILR